MSDERKQKNLEPWDDGVYGTGNTMPPKSHGGILALLLIIVIFLSGIVSALSLLNIRLFQELRQQADGPDDGMTFSFTVIEPSEATESTEQNTEPAQEEAESRSSGDVTLPLNSSPASAENVPQEGGLSWQEIYDAAISSVVSLTCTSSSSTSTGTGVIFSDQGYIVTNNHVVEGAAAITVQLTDGRILDGTLVGADAVSDLAVLYVNADNLQAAEFGDSDALRVGDAVAAIGDPLGVEFRGTMTDGIISAINRDVTVSGRTMTLIQTNAALNAGNSGGPLLNCYGQVVGINTMKISAFADDSGVEGLGFAIPSTTVKEVVDQLIAQGYVSGRPTLGITGQAVTRFDQYYFRLPAGLYITAVEAGSDAESQGIEPGDMLISVNDTQIASQEDLTAVISGLAVGDTVEAVIYRSGSYYTLTLTLGEDKG